MKKIVIILLALQLFIGPNVVLAEGLIESEAIIESSTSNGVSSDEVEVDIEPVADIKAEEVDLLESKNVEILEAPTAEELLAFAASQHSSSDRIREYIKGYQLFPSDNRFVIGINDSVISLLRWARQQHQDGRFDTAIGRYEYILEAPQLEDHLRLETEVRLKFAKQLKQVPTADRMNILARNEGTSSARLSFYIEGHIIYPTDNRFVNGINSNARSLLNWASQQHVNGRFDVAIGRYEFILEAPSVVTNIREETINRLRYAEEGKYPPELLYEAAMSQSTSSARLELLFEGYQMFPQDKRFEQGIHTNVRSLLNWTIRQHGDSKFEVAVGRYEYILSSPVLEEGIRIEVDTRLKYALENKLIPTANQLNTMARNETTSSARLAMYIEGHLLYSNDSRFVNGINSNVRSLLNWASQQHIDGRFEVAIGRYEFILAAPSVWRSLRQETERNLNYAKKEKYPPDLLYDIAMSQSASSARLELLIEGYHMYPDDKRFEQGILTNIRSLLNWTVRQHADGRYDVAIGRYEFILSSPVLEKEVKEEVEIRLKYAGSGKRIPTANQFNTLAANEVTSSGRLLLYVEAYTLYPSDRRFIEGINSSASSLLRWASQQHNLERYDTAIGRYQVILQSPRLRKEIERETRIKLSYAEEGKKIPTASQLLQRASNETTSSARLELYGDGYLLYPGDESFLEGIADSARSLLKWTESRQRLGEFDRAVDRYLFIAQTQGVPRGVQSLANHRLQQAKNGIRTDNAKKVVNAKVQNYSYEQMRKDIQSLQAMYPYLVETRVIGKSLDNRNIYAVKLGHGETEVFFNASNHAREHMTTNVVMKMMDEYAFAYSTANSFNGYDVRKVLDQTSIWFVPMWNPDGVTLVQQGPQALSSKLAQEAIRINGGSRNFSGWKANARGVDLNRQFPALWNTITDNPGRPSPSHYKGPKPLSEPEVIAVYNFVLSRDFKTAVSYHSSGEVIYSRQPGHVALLVSRKTGYPIIDLTRSTSGGGFSDWFVLFHKKPGITPEISPFVGPRPVPVSNWDRVWRQNDTVGLLVAVEAYQNRNNR
ncbi:M14 family metallopeptidase [Bacillus alkalicellulosilyticus]|uniref:M14 family metallopeptidase n=1 Tax=Alkalihalobacterium alkalicellulosilyticum TaxID=1912214 RepID=UPI0009972E80|nr:M14 family metallocarboxypeptidase [Bacillus alkalicellulosilyticus]